MGRTVRGGLPFLLAGLLLAAAPLGAQGGGPPGAAALPAAEGFSVEGGDYLAVAEALGRDAAEAQERARSAALGLLFRSLGKDRLFAEVFVGAPPVGLSFEILFSRPEGEEVRARVSLRVDDESLRIIERGPYLAAALGLLDRAEKEALEASSRIGEGSAAEAEALLGKALVAYGLCEEAARSGLALIEGIEDPSVFSTEGKRTAPDLRRALQVARESAAAGIGRIRAAQAALEVDASGRAVAESARRALAAADRGDALLEESRDILADPSAFGPERLEPLRDQLAMERRAITDARADLGRAREALPEEEGYRADELEFARRRLETVDASLAAAHRSVDREIRDPAARRAARARALRWVFLHASTERLSLRAYLPLGLAPQAEDPLIGAPFDFSVAAEGAFPLGRGGIWVRTRAASATTDLSSERGGDEEYAVSQDFAIGFWRRNLVFAGYQWDWYRGFAGERAPKPGRVEFGLGGVSERERGGGAHRADWLVALSYEIPYDLEDFLWWNVLNAALEAQFRLGDIAVLEASASECLHEGPIDGELAAVFAWAIGFGLRLPPPFLVGAEYCGDLAWPIGADGSWGGLSPGRGGAFRFYLGYTF